MEKLAYINKYDEYKNYKNDVEEFFKIAFRIKEDLKRTSKIYLVDKSKIYNECCGCYYKDNDIIHIRNDSLYISILLHEIAHKIEEKHKLDFALYSSCLRLYYCNDVSLSLYDLSEDFLIDKTEFDNVNYKRLVKHILNKSKNLIDLEQQVFNYNNALHKSNFAFIEDNKLYTLYREDSKYIKNNDNIYIKTY